MKLTLFVPVLLLGCLACNTSKKPTNTLPVVTTTPVTPVEDYSYLPPCLAEQMKKISANQYQSPPIQVDEYEYNGKRMFLFIADCCDQYNILFDENCKGTCAPSGGITGKGDGKCTDFKQKARLVRTVWKKG